MVGVVSNWQKVEDELDAFGESEIDGRWLQQSHPDAVKLNGTAITKCLRRPKDRTARQLIPPILTGSDIVEILFEIGLRQSHQVNSIHWNIEFRKICTSPGVDADRGCRSLSRISISLTAHGTEARDLACLQRNRTNLKQNYSFLLIISMNSTINLKIKALMNAKLWIKRINKSNDKN